MEHLSNRVIALLLTVLVAFCATIGLAGGCNSGTRDQIMQHTEIVVTEAATADSPLDCVPDPDGLSLYYIASKGGERGVFKVEEGKVTEVYVGAPLVDARGISISSDGQVLYIADPQAGTDGALFSLEILGGTPAEIAGASGTAPRAVDVLADASEDQIYFTGTSAAGKPAVFRVGPKAASPEIMFEGAPLVKPDGVLAARSGWIFVTDAGTDPGKVYEVSGTTAGPVGGGLDLGSPAGISALLDESVVLVSSLDPQKGTSQVAMVDPETNKTVIFNGTISANKVSGGLHRAHYANVFGWAGFNKVYLVNVKSPQPSSTPGGVGG